MIDNTEIHAGDKVLVDFISDYCSQDYEEGIVTNVHPCWYFQSRNIKEHKRRDQLEVWYNGQCIIADLESLTLVQNQYQGMDSLEIEEQREMNLIVAIAESVRYKMETLYGAETDLYDYSDEASWMVVEELYENKIEALIVEGLCKTDDGFGCTKKIETTHTWVEVLKYGLYVNVIGEQLNLYMKDEYPKVIIHKGDLPSGVSYEEISYDY